MTLDRAKLGNTASQQMEALEQAYGDDEDAEVGGVLTIVEVLHRQGDEVTSDVRMRVNDAGDPYRVLGLLRAAEQTVMQDMFGGR
jgi:hypothetical protein